MRLELDGALGALALERQAAPRRQDRRGVLLGKVLLIILFDVAEGKIKRNSLRVVCP